jgi:hypothetical protein
MFDDFKGPSFIFWPVGCGDSTTVAISDSENLQIDLNDCAIAEADSNEKIPLVDELVAKLPKRGGKPYLSCFVLTHPDLDHCRGFEDLLKRVTIGELWHTPRVFREYHKDMCADAVAFRKEAHRRAKETIKVGGDPGAGNRVRIVGYDNLLKEDMYRDFPEAFFSVPGHSITMLDGANVEDRFFAFIHAPFKDDSAGERNETSLALQIVVGNAESEMRGLFFGDLSYPTLRRVFDEAEKNDNLRRLNWNVLLAPHHCSKKVMYQKDADSNDVLQQDILDDIKKRQYGGGFIVASSPAIPGNNSPGDNPPHAKAKNRYQEIVSGGFICTGEHSTPEKMRPLVFTVRSEGMQLVDKDYLLSEEAKTDLAKAVAAARGTNAPPTAKVGFGHE